MLRTRFTRISCLVILSLLLLVLPSAAQVAVTVGKGSYAEFPPPEIAGKMAKIESQELFLVKPDDRPIPSNKWWTQLVVSRFARSLWSIPLRVDTGKNGVEVCFPIKWASAGNDPVCDLPVTLGGDDYAPADARAKDWSDWSVSFRMEQSAEKYMDVTLGEGMPYVWVEYHGVRPVLNFPNGVTPAFFDMEGKAITSPVVGDAIGITVKDRHFGLFAPDGTTFKNEDRKLTVDFSGKSQFLVLCPLPAMKDLSYFHQYAYAIPRDTQFSWAYDAGKGMVTTNWKIITETLKGSEKRIIQGWIPHHYRNTVNTLAFNGLEYLSPRGKMRCSVGNEFSISYPFTGIVPNLPAPRKIGGEHDFDSQRMNGYLAELAEKQKYGADTYWGGKDILRLGQCALMSQQLNNENFGKFKEELRTAMVDWFTYTPGETEHYFVRYPKWKALVGIKPSYGSEGFNDHHFHYGYFTFASALLAMHDRAFAADYGEMATLVAKEYANWDHSDTRFPFLRTFDIWAGHSWAGGTSSPGGENQESSSEAVQSWAGLVYLGQALGNKEMTAAGVMGYAVETEATLEYWFNAGGDVFPPEWKHPVTGMVWSGGKVFGTYFTGDPAWVYGINWLPASPMLSYLVRDPAFARKNYENMCRDFEANEEKEAAKKNNKKPHEVRPATIKTFGPALGSVMLGYVLMYDPDWVADQLDTLWSEPGDNIAHNAGEMTVMYYQAHSMRSLGLVDWKCRGNSPTSMVYYNDRTKIRTFIAWNPRENAETVTFYQGTEALGKLIAAPQALTSATTLSK